MNLMKAISFLADGDSGKCHSVKVKRDHCHVYVNNAPLNGSFDFDDICVWTSSKGQRIGVSVPNCQNNTRAKLTFWITCTNVLGDEALQLQVLYADGLRPSSHGILGKLYSSYILRNCYKYIYTVEPPLMDTSQRWTLAIKRTLTQVPNNIG